MSPLDRPLAVTFFADAFAKTKREESLSLRGLADRARDTTAPIRQNYPGSSSHRLATFERTRARYGTTPTCARSTASRPITT